MKIMIKKVELIQNFIDEINSLPSQDFGKLESLIKRADIFIRRIFGDTSSYLNKLSEIVLCPENYQGCSVDAKYWESGTDSLRDLFNTMKNELELSDMSVRINETPDSRIEPSNKIFIVHGHDEAMKQAVARTIEKLELVPIILHEQPNKGRTIVEKFTDYADVSFAVVLFSPDDLAYPRDQIPKNPKFRARQNVIFELGFFIGHLGRNSVFILKKQEKNFEMLSDYEGVVYTTFDKSDQWKLELFKELKERGFEVDANKLV